MSDTAPAENSEVALRPCVSSTHLRAHVHYKEVALRPCVSSTHLRAHVHYKEAQPEPLSPRLRLQIAPRGASAPVHRGTNNEGKALRCLASKTKEEEEGNKQPKIKK